MASPNVIFGVAVVGLGVALGGYYLISPQSFEPTTAEDVAPAAGAPPEDGDRQAARQARTEDPNRDTAEDVAPAAGTPPERGDRQAARETEAEDPDHSAARPGSRPATGAKKTPQVKQEGAPSFDIVRVDPSGEAVIAGRAAPDSKVTVLESGRPVGEARADARGEFVIIPELRLKPGSRSLSLLAKRPDGQARKSENAVVLSVPERGPRSDAKQAGAPKKPLAVLVPESGSGASRILQRPTGEGIRKGELVLEAIDYGADGGTVISGRGPPGSRLLIYLDNRLIGDITVGKDGRWELVLNRPLAPGLYSLRIDQVGADGKVIARVETPFARAETLAAKPGEDFVIVQPGNSLWRIARRTLGRGIRYTLIFEANQSQIRDPDLIYPGQIFILPEGKNAQEAG